MTHILVFPVILPISELVELDILMDQLSTQDVYRFFLNVSQLEPEYANYILSRVLYRISRFENRINNVITLSQYFALRRIPSFLTLDQIVASYRSNELVRELLNDIAETCGLSSNFMDTATDEHVFALAQPRFTKLNLAEQFQGLRPEKYKLEIRSLAASVYFPMADVLNLDEIILNTKAPFPEGTEVVACVLLDDDGIYVGHVFGWTFNHNPSVMGMIGIRSSFRQQLLRKCGYTIPNISYEFIATIKTWAHMKNAQYIFIEQPLGPMPAILRRCGLR